MENIDITELLNKMGITEVSEEEKTEIEGQLQNLIEFQLEKNLIDLLGEEKVKSLADKSEEDLLAYIQNETDINLDLMFAQSLLEAKEMFIADLAYVQGVVDGKMSEK